MNHDPLITMPRSRLLLLLQAALARGMGRRDYDLTTEEELLLAGACEAQWGMWIRAELDAAEREVGK